MNRNYLRYSAHSCGLSQRGLFSVFNKKIPMKTKKLFTLFVLTAFALTSCIPVDDPDDPGANREKFLGSWTCTETNRKGPAYEVVVNENPDFYTKVNIKNFGLLGNEAAPSADVSGDQIAVPGQYCHDDNSWYVEGDGVMTTNNRIDWEYELNDGSTLYQVVAVYDRN